MKFPSPSGSLSLFIILTLSIHKNNYILKKQPLPIGAFSFILNSINKNGFKVGRTNLDTRRMEEIMIDLWAFGWEGELDLKTLNEKREKRKEKSL